MSPHLPDPSRRRKVFAVVSLGVFMSSLDLFIVNIAFPDIQRDFGGTSLASVSWILNAYAIVFAALLVPAGRIADRVGRRRVFLTGLGVFTAASALCAVAPSVELLVAARVLQAVGGALMLPTSLGLLLPEFPPERRATAVGLWAAVGGVAAAAGPPLGGLLVQADWRWIFLVNVPLGVIGIVAGSRVLREVRDPDQGRFPDLLGAAFLIAGIATLTLAIVKGPSGAGARRASSVASPPRAVLVGATLLRSARVPAPVIELPMLRVRSFALANVGSVFFFIGFASMLLTGVLFQDRRVARVDPARRAAARPRPLHGGALRGPRGPARGPLRAARRRGSRRAAVRVGLRLVVPEGRPHARLRRRAVAGTDADRRRGRPDDLDAVQRRRRIAAAEPLRHRHRHPRDVAPDRQRDRRRDRDRDPRHAGSRAPAGALRLGLAVHVGDVARRRRRLPGPRARAGGRNDPGARAIRERGPRGAAGMSAAEQTRTRTIAWEDPVRTAERAAGLSGLEYMGQVRDGEIRRRRSRC